MTTPKMANNLQRAIPHSNLVCIEDGGHMMMIEYPDETLDVLKDFLEALLL